MKILDFIEQIPVVILDRAKDYIVSGLTQKLSEAAPGEWVAFVRGTDKYKVQIWLKDEDIIRWHCSCPFDMGDVCKHTAAVAIMLKDILVKAPVISSNCDSAIDASQKSQPAKELMVKLSVAEWQSFAQYLFAHDDGA